MSRVDHPPVNVVTIFEQCLGCKWALHVLSQIRQGVRRPGQLERSAEGLTTKVLNERLTKLVRYGILKKVSYSEVPLRVEYHLTPFGLRFVEILDEVEALQRELLPSAHAEAARGRHSGTGGHSPVRTRKAIV